MCNRRVCVVRWRFAYSCENIAGIGVLFWCYSCRRRGLVGSVRVFSVCSLGFIFLTVNSIG